MPEVGEPGFVLQAVYDVPLGRGGATVAVELEARVGDGVHAGVDALKARNHVLGKLVGVAREEADR